jgi:hypothetical protein
MSQLQAHRNTWRLSSTLYLRYYSNRDSGFWIRVGNEGSKSRPTSTNVIRLILENQEKLCYGLTHNRDVFFNRIVPGHGTVSLGFDQSKNIKLYISTGRRWEKGTSIALSKYELAVLIDKSTLITQKMKVCYILYNII